MKKLICMILLAAALLPVQAYAIEDSKVITDVASLSANLYLSDWNDNEVVLKNVKAVNTDDWVANAAAPALEYTAVPSHYSNVWGKDGAELDLKSLAWYLDMDVQVTVAKLADGTYRIIYIKVK